MARVFEALLEETGFLDRRLWKLPRRGKRGKRTACFPPFPPRLENSAKNTTPSFPQFPQPLLLDIVMKKKTDVPRRPNQIGLDKMVLKA